MRARAIAVCLRVFRSPSAPKRAARRVERVALHEYHLPRSLADRYGARVPGGAPKARVKRDDSPPSHRTHTHTPRTLPESRYYLSQPQFLIAPLPSIGERLLSHPESVRAVAAGVNELPGDDDKERVTAKASQPYTQKSALCVCVCAAPTTQPQHRAPTSADNQTHKSHPTHTPRPVVG